MTVKNIKDGWLNFMKSCISRRSLDPDLLNIVESRIKICSECPSLVVTKRMGFVSRSKGGTCGCFFPMLAYARGKSCPEGKWGSVPDETKS